MSPWMCKDTDLKMREMVGNRLGEEERERAERHVEGCERCREAVSLWSGFVGDIQRAQPAPPSRTEKRRIIDAALSGSRAKATKKPDSMKPAFAFAVAACAALGVWGYVHQLDKKEAAVELRDNGSADSSLENGPMASTEIFEEQNPTSEISAEGRAHVRLSDDVVLWADQRARWSVQAWGGKGTMVDLCSGLIVVEIGPLWDGSRFVVKTPDGEVEARGTVFSVDVDEVEGTRATVASGVVELRRRLESGFSESYTVDSGSVGSLAEENSRPASSDDIQLISSLMIGDAGTREVPKQRGETERGGQEQTIDEELSRLLVEAKDLRKEGDFLGAAGIYKSILRRDGKSSGALDALVSLAQIELNELSKPTDALQHYKDYLEASPRGFLAETARIGLVRTADVLGLEDEIVRASEEYEKLHNAGPFSAEVMVLKADALRRSGRCEKADAAYRRVLESWPHSAYAKQAQHGLELCSEK